jgi:hypothetical protein
MEFVAESFSRRSSRLRFSYDFASHALGGRDARFLRVLAERLVGRRARCDDHVFRDPLRDPIELGILLGAIGYWLPENWPVISPRFDGERGLGAKRD